MLGFRASAGYDGAGSSWLRVQEPTSRQWTSARAGSCGPRMPNLGNGRAGGAESIPCVREVRDLNLQTW